MEQNGDDDPYKIVLTNEICEKLFPAALWISFRLNKVYHICCSTISIISIIYFIRNHRCSLKFHFNIKIMFYFQFASCFLFALSIGISQIHHLITSLLATQPCDVVISPMFYAVFNIMITSLSISATSSLVLMVFERTLASCFLTCYEKTTRKFGISMACLAGIIPIIATYFMYYDVTFDYPQMSVISSHPKNAARHSYCFISMFIIYLIISIHSIYLHNYNRKWNNSIRRRTEFGLSSQYQMSENVASSQILWQLTTAQVTIYLIFVVSLNTIRYFVPKPRPPLWQVMTEVTYMPPLYCAAMPLLCIYTIRKTHRERTHKIHSMVSLRSTGSEGWDNYQKMLKDQWA